MEFDSGVASMLLGLGTFFFIFVFAIAVFAIVVQWKLFTKAGKEGWYALIPIYNLVVLQEIAGFKWYYVFIYLVTGVPLIGPFIGGLVLIFWNIVLNVKIAKSFGKEVGFGVGMAFFTLIFRAIIAFDKSVEYKGPVVNGDIDFKDLF